MNHVWSYDFVQDRTHNGRAFRTLNIIDEFTKEALMIRVDRKLNSTDVVDALTDLFSVLEHFLCLLGRLARVTTLREPLKDDGCEHLAVQQLSRVLEKCFSCVHGILLILFQ